MTIASGGFGAALAFVSPPSVHRVALAERVHFAETLYYFRSSSSPCLGSGGAPAGGTRFFVACSKA